MRVDRFTVCWVYSRIMKLNKVLTTIRLTDPPYLYLPSIIVLFPFLRFSGCASHTSRVDPIRLQKVMCVRSTNQMVRSYLSRRWDYHGWNQWVSLQFSPVRGQHFLSDFLSLCICFVLCNCQKISYGHLKVPLNFLIVQNVTILCASTPFLRLCEKQNCFRKQDRSFHLPFHYCRFVIIPNTVIHVCNISGLWITISGELLS